MDGSLVKLCDQESLVNGQTIFTAKVLHCASFSVELKFEDESGPVVPMGDVVIEGSNSGDADSWKQIEEPETVNVAKYLTYFWEKFPFAFVRGRWTGTSGGLVTALGCFKSET